MTLRPKPGGGCSAPVGTSAARSHPWASLRCCLLLIAACCSSLPVGSGLAPEEVHEASLCWEEPALPATGLFPLRNSERYSCRHFDSTDLGLVKVNSVGAGSQWRALPTLQGAYYEAGRQGVAAVPVLFLAARQARMMRSTDLPSLATDLSD